MAGRPADDRQGAAPRLFGETPLETMPFGRAGNQIHLPTHDEDWPPSDLKRRVVLGARRNRFLFPLRDLDEAWCSREEARDTFQEVLPLGWYMSRAD